MQVHVYVYMYMYTYVYIPARLSCIKSTSEHEPTFQGIHVRCHKIIGGSLSEPHTDE